MAPCPCGNTCRCHIRRKESRFVWIILYVALPLLLLMLFGTIHYAIKHPPPARHIQVDGKDCIVEYISDGCTSTGACWGHDIAVCPKE